MTRPQAARRRQTGVTRPAATQPRINGEESPLAWLASRKDKDGQPLLSREQFEAGERLRRDFTFAHLGPRVTASWSPVPPDKSSRRCGGGSAHDMVDNVLAARQQVNRALAAVGPDLSGVLLDVCCFLKGMELVESERGWPVRSAKVVLKTALAALARHYSPAARRSANRPMLHWGSEDYRPSMSAD